MGSDRFDCAQSASRCQLGFTIIELMMTVVLLGVLMTLAAPNLTNLVREQRVKTATSDLYVSLIYARSESIKRNMYVAVCAKNSDGSGCGNTTDWSKGWIVFLDADGNGYPGAVSDILKKQDAFSDLTLTGTVSNVSYQRDGRLRAAASTFVISSSVSATVVARCVSLDLSGRPNTKVDTNNNASDGCQ